MTRDEIITVLRTELTIISTYYEDDTGAIVIGCDKARAIATLENLRDMVREIVDDEPDEREPQSHGPLCLQRFHGAAECDCGEADAQQEAAEAAEAAEPPPEPTTPTDADTIMRAREQYQNQSDLPIRVGDEVRRGEDAGGAYVSAWVWVADPEVEA